MLPATVPRWRIRAHRFDQPRDGGGRRGGEHVGVAGACPDRQVTVLAAQVRQLVQGVDVDQVVRVGQPQVHQRDQALPPGQDPGLATQITLQVESLGDRRRPVVAERW